jgi:CheY-like chemotaxis protein
VSSHNDSGKAVFTFLSKLNHDLRTPLTAMLNMIRLIREEPQRHCTPENLDLIHEAGEELKSLVQDITDMARLESGVLALKMAPFSIRQVLQQAGSKFSANAVEKNIDLRLAVDDAVPDRIIGDKARLLQILSHLIANAVTYTEKGAVIVRASRIAPEKAAQGGDRLGISVQDSGEGIPESLQNQLFDRYVRPEGDGLVKTSGGRGLGLALSKRLVHLMGGHLRVQSTVGKGSTFTFDLPVREVEGPAVKPAVNKPADLADFGHLKVLVVEDNFINQLSFCQMLERCGFVIHSASNGKQALELIERHQFDIVLMDVKMPVMDGLEATRRIRSSKDPRINTTKVVALTAYAMPEDRKLIMEAGMNDVISKPIEVEELVNVLKKVLK